MTATLSSSIQKAGALPDDGFVPLVQRYIGRANEHERSTPDIVEQIRDGLSFDGGFWLIRQEHGNLVGFAFATIMEADYSGAVAVVHHVYVDPRCKDLSVIERLDEELEKWAKMEGAHALAFYTRRKPGAFLRRLKKPWHLDSYVLKRPI